MKKWERIDQDAVEQFNGLVRISLFQAGWRFGACDRCGEWSMVKAIRKKHQIKACLACFDIQGKGIETGGSRC